MAFSPARRPAAWTRGLAVLALPVLLSPAAAAESLDFAYQVAWGHITLAEASVSHVVLGERYTLSGQGRTEGLFGLLFDWEGAARTEGTATSGAPRPLSHSHQGTLNGKTRQTRVEWRAGAAPRSESSPPPDRDEVTPVPAASTIGTADPFTVLLAVLESLKRDGRCQARAKVWDGRRRYDLVVQHLGPDELVADRPWSYAGPSVKCRLRVERIGGFRREAASWRTEEDTGERAIWAADIGGGRFVPVRAELETAFGTIVGRLKQAGAAQTEAQARGVMAKTEERFQGR